MELDLPERKVILDGQGKVVAIVPRARLDSHRLIEEFMIAANVAARLDALTGQPALYRANVDAARVRRLR